MRKQCAVESVFAGSCWLRFWLATTAPVAPASAALSDLWPFGQSTPKETIPDPLPYTVTFSAPDAGWSLERSLRQASDLVNRQKSPASGMVGLLARARQDLGRLTAVLYENARYAGEVFITVDGKPLAKVDPFATIGARPVPVTITIKPGAEFTFARVSATPLPAGLTLEALGLVSGAPARSSVVVDAEAKLVEAWQEQGHPLAAAGKRDTIADHRTNTLDVALAVHPGPRANFGRVTVSGTRKRRSESRAAPRGHRRRALFVEGREARHHAPARPRRLRQRSCDARSQARSGRDHPDRHHGQRAQAAGDRRQRQLFQYRRARRRGLLAPPQPFRRRRAAEVLRLDRHALLDGAFDPDFRLAGTFRKPAVFDPMTDFTLRVEGYRETTDAYRVTALESEVGLEHTFSDTLTGSLGLELARSRTVEPRSRKTIC